MQDEDWIFEMLSELGDAAETAGMDRLTTLLELCMDVYIEEERIESAIAQDAVVFRSNRVAVGENRGADLAASWLQDVERRVLHCARKRRERAQITVSWTQSPQWEHAQIAAQ